MKHKTFTGDDGDIVAIKTIIEENYIRGIHVNLDEETVRRGFHPDFRMIVQDQENDEIANVSISQWVEKMEGFKKADPNFSNIKTTYEISMINVTGNAASVRIDVFKDAHHAFTDYMLAYKFAAGWRIVSKIFHRHP